MAIERGGVIDFEEDDWEEIEREELINSGNRSYDNINYDNSSSIKDKISKKEPVRKKETTPDPGKKELVKDKEHTKKTADKKASKKIPSSKEVSSEDTKKAAKSSKSADKDKNDIPDNSTVKKSTKKTANKKASKKIPSSKEVSSEDTKKAAKSSKSADKDKVNNSDTIIGDDTKLSDNEEASVEDSPKDEKPDDEYLTLPSINTGKIWGIIAFALFIALIVSIFTSGFNQENNLSKEAVSDKILSFVKSNSGINDVDVISVSEESSLYKVVLSIKGNNMDTYITKDGRILLPSAINLSESREINVIKNGSQQVEASSPSSDASSSEDTPSSDNTESSSSSLNTDDNSSINNDGTPNSDEAAAKSTDNIKNADTNTLQDNSPADGSSDSTVNLNMAARRYRFIPYEISVSKGSEVILNIRSEDIEHTFTLDEFGIDEVVPAGGSTQVRFTADKTGKYEFRSKSSPAMRGTLIVE